LVIKREYNLWLFWCGLGALLKIVETTKLLLEANACQVKGHSFDVRSGLKSQEKKN
jgi:hypothetical protein